MSKMTDHCEKDIKAMLKGDKKAETICRLTLEGIAKSDNVPVEAIAACLRAAIKEQNTPHLESN